MTNLLAKLHGLYVKRAPTLGVGQRRIFEDLASLVAQTELTPQETVLWLILSSRVKFEENKIEEGTLMLESAESAANSAQHFELLPEIHRLQAEVLRRQGKTTEAFNLLARALASAELHKDEATLAVTCLNLGVLFANNGDYDEASVYLKRCIEYSNQGLVEPIHEADAHLILAQAQLERGAVDEAYFHSKKALEEHTRLGNQARILTCSLFFASVSTERKDFESARQVLESISRESLSPFQEVSYLNLISKLDGQDGRLDDGIKNHDEAIALAIKIGNERLRVNSIELKCETLIASGKAHETLEQLAQIAEDRVQGYDLLGLHELRGKAFEATEQYREALVEQKKFAILQKELLSERASNALSRLRAAQEVLQAEREAAHFRERSHFYAKELSQRTSYLVQQNTYVSEVIDHLKLLSIKRPDAIDLLKEIQKKLRQLPAATFDWEEYLRLFDEIHPNAIATLKLQYPELTETEAKICSFALAKLTNVEIGRLLTITERAVENHRHRLRKKLGVAPGVDLTAFLERTLAERATPKNTGV